MSVSLDGYVADLNDNVAERAAVGVQVAPHNGEIVGRAVELRLKVRQVAGGD